MSKTVVVGMSGGVDSSVTALLLKEQGFDVIGLFMKNWDEKDESGICRASLDYEDVLAVCDKIQIPCYTVNFVETYWNEVFHQFLEELKIGLTPNPDILCNREIKFKALLEKALDLKADFLATGHYCRTQASKTSYQLLKGADPDKDQSYFLYTIHSSSLSKVLFPIGDLKKSTVRQIAREHRLPTSEKKDSTGICFIGERNFKQFISQYIGYKKGNFENLDGKIVGEHDGVAYYTIGQRKGLRIGGNGAAWFVVGKDVKRNVVIVEQGADHPALYAQKLIAKEASWVGGTPPQAPFHCQAKIRYRQQDQECFIENIGDDHLCVVFEKPQRAITPRQSIVFYDKEICLGGAMIEVPLAT
ncbi:MAG: tRNA 2-thiouridine(34) synthase MnmA [Anaerolineae bacterium]